MPGSAEKVKIPPHLISALKELALLGCQRDPVLISSGKLGRMLHKSQQTASLYMQKLEDLGLIERTDGGRLFSVGITDLGMEALRREYLSYQVLFQSPSMMLVRGTIQSGLGEGKYYITRKGYKEQVREVLGFSPYPGTVNIKVLSRDLNKMHLLKEMKGIGIQGFKMEGRSFGQAKCFQCDIQGRSCAVIMPNRTHHSDVLEIIAPEFLRESLNLEDGQELVIRIII